MHNVCDKYAKLIEIILEIYTSRTLIGTGKSGKFTTTLYFCILTFLTLFRQPRIKKTECTCIEFGRGFHKFSTEFLEYFLSIGSLLLSTNWTRRRVHGVAPFSPKGRRKISIFQREHLFSIFVEHPKSQSLVECTATFQVKRNRSIYGCVITN